MDWLKIMSNPIRMQIMQALQVCGEATTKQLSQALPQIPAPTLYRHVDYMLKEGILCIKEERRIRGSTERLLAINQELFRKAEEGDMTGIAYQFLMDIFFRFEKYSRQKTKDPAKDMLALRTRVLSLSDEDMLAFFMELGQMMDRYEEKGKSTQGRLRSISIISAPYEEEEKGNKKMQK